MESQRHKQQTWGLHSLCQILCVYVVVWWFDLFCGTPNSGSRYIYDSFICSLGSSSLLCFLVQPQYTKFFCSVTVLCFVLVNTYLFEAGCIVKGKQKCLRGKGQMRKLGRLEGEKKLWWGCIVLGNNLFSVKNSRENMMCELLQNLCNIAKIQFSLSLYIHLMKIVNYLIIYI